MPKYKAIYKHYDIISPNSDSIPPTFEYKRERGKSELNHTFIAENDALAIKVAKQYAKNFYNEVRKYVLPRGKKNLANIPSLEKIFEIIPPRRIELDKC
jgi:hypothetical protein